MMRIGRERLSAEARCAADDSPRIATDLRTTGDTPLLPFRWRIPVREGDRVTIDAVDTVDATWIRVTSRAVQQAPAKPVCYGALVTNPTRPGRGEDRFSRHLLMKYPNRLVKTPVSVPDSPTDHMCCAVIWSAIRAGHSVTSVTRITSWSRSCKPVKAARDRCASARCALGTSRQHSPHQRLKPGN